MSETSETPLGFLTSDTSPLPGVSEGWRMPKQKPFHRRTKPDRLTAPDLVARKKAIEIDDLLKPLIKRKSRADQKWGYDRLLEIVPTEWARKFGIAHEALEQALIAEEPDTKHIADRADNLIRAYNKLDEIADTSGAEVSPEMCWHMEVSGKPAVLALDQASQRAALKLYPDHIVYTIAEIERLLELRELDLVNKAKEVFAGAEVTGVRQPKRETAETLDQDIPFAPEVR